MTPTVGGSPLRVADPTTVWPRWADDAALVYQPNSVFVSSRSVNRFDVFSFEAALQLERIDGSASVVEIVESIGRQFPQVERAELHSDLCDLLAYLEERGYISCEEQPFRSTERAVVGTGDEVRAVHADIELTRRCNLRCAYCYAWAGGDHPEASAVEWIDTLSRLRDQGLAALTISGGEPFMHPAFREIMEWCAPRLVCTLNTNGGLIGEAEADWLAALDLQCVQLSLDADIPEPHDAQRGRGAWRAARTALDHLVARSVPVRISMTVHKANKDRVALVAALADELGAELNVEVMKPVGRASHLSDDRFLEQACEIAGARRLLDVYRHLAAMEIHCQAQLGFVGVSAECRLKPCNLTEDFFEEISAPVVVEIGSRFRYEDTPTYSVIDDACRSAGDHPVADEHGRSRCVLSPST